MNIYSIGKILKNIEEPLKEIWLFRNNNDASNKEHYCSDGKRLSFFSLSFIQIKIGEIESKRSSTEIKRGNMRETGREREIV